MSLSLVMEKDEASQIRKATQNIGVAWSGLRNTEVFRVFSKIIKIWVLISSDLERTREEMD